MAEPKRKLLIKPVITIDEAGLGRAVLSLWEQVSLRGAPPDAIVGIATGGLLCAEKLKDRLNVPVFSCAMRRPSTAAKNSSPLQVVLHSLPYAISNCLRRIEDRVLANAASKAPPANRQPSAQLLADVAAIKDAAVALGLRHVLVLDDAVDSGATLGCVVSALRAAFSAETRITTAVICETRSSASFRPDVALFRETLCRFPWSLDFRGA